MKTIFMHDATIELETVTTQISDNISSKMTGSPTVHEIQSE